MRVASSSSRGRTFLIRRRTDGLAGSHFSFALISCGIAEFLPLPPSPHSSYSVLLSLSLSTKVMQEEEEGEQSPYLQFMCPMNFLLLSLSYKRIKEREEGGGRREWPNTLKGCDWFLEGGP